MPKRFETRKLKISQNVIFQIQYLFEITILVEKLCRCKIECWQRGGVSSWVTCNIQHSVIGMQLAAFSMLHATCSILCIAYNMQCLGQIRFTRPDCVSRDDWLTYIYPWSSLSQAFCHPWSGLIRKEPGSEVHDAAHSSDIWYCMKWQQSTSYQISNLPESSLFFLWDKHIKQLE